MPYDPEVALRAVNISANQRAIVKFVEEAFVTLAKDVVSVVPDCADRTAGLRILRQAKHEFIEAICKG